MLRWWWHSVWDSLRFCSFCPPLSFSLFFFLYIHSNAKRNKNKKGHRQRMFKAIKEKKKTCINRPQHYSFPLILIRRSPSSAFSLFVMCIYIYLYYLLCIMLTNSMRIDRVGNCAELKDSTFLNKTTIINNLRSLYSRAGRTVWPIDLRNLASSYR